MPATNGQGGTSARTSARKASPASGMPPPVSDPLRVAELQRERQAALAAVLLDSPAMQAMLAQQVQCWEILRGIAKCWSLIIAPACGGELPSKYDGQGYVSYPLWHNIATTIGLDE